MYVIEFRFEDDDPIVAPAREGETLLAVAKRAGVPIQAPCSGLGSCGKCRVQLLSGSLSAAPSYYIPDDEYAEGWRLACTARICGDACVLVGE